MRGRSCDTGEGIAELEYYTEVGLEEGEVGKSVTGITDPNGNAQWNTREDTTGLNDREVG